ncbi:CPBP family intramembrane metalloprotease [Clostridium sp. YIM B02515]|uniref:CPBP family intramembrane metalloprotease n=1 Tax=Clostridium rhizosphaerae TaxID=2803861 RepID=A0ABS1THK7_9CLOT|nr:CPBP family intramembrane glutamic endopeptidase [Clostridium rhizosphaerae]MBL4937433.1 CPBP family intramembrane metalloprotease [Clostridium rhizosphaerae]
MGAINILKELGLSLLNFFVLGVIIYFLTKNIKIKNYEVKFSNPRKNALCSILAVTLSSCIIITLMALIKAQNTSETVSRIESYSLNSIVNIAISWLILLSPILIMKKINKETWESTGILKYNLKESVSIGLILAAIAMLSAVLFGSINLEGIGQKLTLNAIYAFIYYSVVGFCEEFMYRGYLQTRLISWVGIWRGWVITSIFMALIHIPQRMVSMGLPLKEAFINSVLLIPISLTMGYIQIKTKNIAAAGIYHTFANWINIFI